MYHRELVQVQTVVAVHVCQRPDGTQLRLRQARRAQHLLGLRAADGSVDGRHPLTFQIRSKTKEIAVRSLL